MKKLFLAPLTVLFVFLLTYTSLTSGRQQTPRTAKNLAGSRAPRVAAAKENKASLAPAPGVSFVTVPPVLPSDTPFGDYSPLVSLHYDGLNAEIYTLKVFLLETETGSFNCGCETTDQMWCGATFVIDNHAGNNAAGGLLDARKTNIHRRTGFLWVADLYNQANVKVFTATQAAASTLNRAPVLSPIGNRVASVGQNLDFDVSAADAETDAINLSAANLPAGATFNAGHFHWQPTTAGTYSQISFTVTQSGAPQLSDSELVTIQVSTSPNGGVLSFTKNAYTTGEGGPAELIVNRATSSLGAVTVAYSTSNGSANAGSDYAAVSGTLSFADGETTKAIRVPIINDAAVEGNETFQATLSAPTGGATLGAQAQATITISDDDNPQSAGQWDAVMTWPTVPIHMHLLPNGKVVFWDRHNDDVMPMWDVTPRLWDPANPGVFTSLPTPAWDIFCSGHTLMADGRLFVAGGHLADFVGTSTAGIYDQITNSWSALPDMNAGRWYPSTLVLANGEVLVLAGTRAGYSDINQLPQIWQVKSGSWRNLNTAMLGGLPVWADYYPYLYVAPNGKVFNAGPQQTARYLDTAGTGAWSDVANSSMSYRDYGSSVMYDQGKVLIVGGNSRDNEVAPTILPSDSADVIDLNTATPAWRAVASMSVGRRHLNTTLLPDGKVLVTGGSCAPGHDEPAGAVFFGELWDPVTELWTPVAAHSRYRGYHSNAMLLPDGRVLVAGGGHPDPPGGGAENNAEIYSPPYLFKGARPTITATPSGVGYGQAFTVQTPNAASITGVTWIRLSSVTHAFNESQRINKLSFVPVSGGLQVTAPANANLCPPGHYLLFILNGNGVPSIARVVQIFPTTMQFSAVNYSVGEGDVFATITVTRAGDMSAAATVDFASSNGTATQTRDYQVANGTLSFAAGETSKTFRILVVNDAHPEGSEDVGLALSNPTGGIVATPATATLTITDNDSAGTTSPAARQFVSNLVGAEEVPATANAVKGNGGIFQLSNDELSAKVSLTFSGLTGSETGAHVHAGAPGVNGPIIFPLPLGNPINNFAVNPTAQQVIDLRAGQQYMNVHSAGFLNGEIRGQLLWNPAEEADFFVRQAYFDFLSRVPDAGGFSFWQNEITQCQSDVQCLRNKRVDVSNAFFYEQEFQQTAAYVLRLYRAAYGNNQPFPNPNPNPGFPNEDKKLPSYAVFVTDRSRVIGGANLAQKQLELANLFVTRAEFSAKYPVSLSTAAQFVDAVLVTLQSDLGVNLTGQRANLINLYNAAGSAAGGRGAVMYRLADDNASNPIANQPLINAEYNRSFVLGQYFGYLRRNPDIAGFVFWLGQVNGAPLRDVPKQHAMVCSFITSGEYQLRFGPVASRNNNECPQ